MANTVDFAVFCASSARRVSCEHLNCKKHPMVSISHVLSCEKNSEKIAGFFTTQSWFNAADNPYTNEEFFKVCEDYGIPYDPIR